MDQSAGDVRPWTLHQGRIVITKPLFGRVPHGGIYDAVAPLTGDGWLMALAPPEAVPPEAAPAGPDQARLDPPAPPYLGLAVPHPPGEPLVLLPRPWPDNAARHLLGDLVDLVRARRADGHTSGWLQPELIGIDARGPRRPEVAGADLTLLPFLHRHGVTLEGPVLRRLFASPWVLAGGPVTPADEVWTICAIGAWMVTGEHLLRPGKTPTVGAPDHTFLMFFGGTQVLRSLLLRGLTADPTERIGLDELADALKKEPTGRGRPVHVRPPAEPADPSEEPSWRGDPRIMGRFSTEFPDDLQVIIHDGDPDRSGTPPELAWVRVTRANDRFYDAVLLNEPEGVQSISAGQPLRFLMPRGQMPPVMATSEYLADLERWEAGRCTNCGADELLDPLGELLTSVVGELPDTRAVDTYVAPCAWCRIQGWGGRIVVSRRPPPHDDLARPVTGRPEPEVAWWEARTPDPDDFPVGVPAGLRRYMIDERWGGTAEAGRYWGWDITSNGVIITTSREQRRLHADVAADLAMPVEGMAPVLDVVRVDRAGPGGERLMALVERAPPASPWAKTKMPRMLVGWVLASVAEILERLIRGGFPLPTVALDSVWIGDDAKVWLTGRSDLFIAGALPVPHQGPQTWKPLWSHTTMPPGQLTSGHGGDESAAVWSLGVAGMLAATGRHPLGGGGPMEQMRTLAAGGPDLSPLDALPDDLGGMLRRALAVEPPTRPRLAEFATLRRPPPAGSA